MVENVNAVAGSLVEASDYRIPVANTAPSNELGKDAFLQLLVAQLKYQDPLEPSSSSDFIATTAQFTVVEKLDELTKQGANSMLVTSLTTASALVGREVTATQGDGTVTAVVKQSRLVSGEVVLDTDKGPISLVDILSVGAAPATSTPIAPTTSVAPAAQAIPTAVAPTTSVATVTPAPVTPAAVAPGTVTPAAVAPATSVAASTAETDPAGSKALVDPAPVGSTEPIEPGGTISGAVPTPVGETVEVAAPAVDVAEVLSPTPVSEVPAPSAETVAPVPAEPDPLDATLVDATPVDATPAIPRVVRRTDLPLLVTEAPPEPEPPSVNPPEVVDAAPATDPAATETPMAIPAEPVAGSGAAETPPTQVAIAPADEARPQQPFDPFESP